MWLTSIKGDSMEYISKLTEKQVEKILDLTSDGSSS